MEENNKTEKGINLYNYIGTFFTACVIGWIYEMIFYKLTENILENRGFLYGPYVPVYGFGAILLVGIWKRFKKNPVVFFIIAMLVTGVLEYIVGAFMLEIWGKRWWDYTGLFMNINGHVCLRSVISFAIGGLGLYIIEPLINKYNSKLSKKKANILYGILILIMVVDLILCLAIRHPILLK